MRLVPLMVALLNVAPVAILAQDVDGLRQRVWEQAAHQLQSSGDFVCLELVDRARWSGADGAGGDPYFADALRLDVGWVGGAEVFGWPGADELFDYATASQMFPDGAFSTGDFLSHARTLFVSRKGRVLNWAEEEIDGESVLRFDYVVSELPTGYRLTTGSGSSEVLYHGSVWAAAESMDVRRLTVEADAIPETVGIESIVTSIAYRNVALKGGQALLPKQAEIHARYAGGARLRNIAQFENCRAFETSSTIRFESLEDEASESTEGEDQIALPKNSTLALRLLTPIEWGVSRVGDELEAELLKSVHDRGRIIAEKGDVVSLRLRLLHKRTQPTSFFVVGLSLEAYEGRLESFEAPGSDARILDLEELRDARGPQNQIMAERMASPDPAGMTSLYVFASKLSVVGARMRWRVSGALSRSP